MNRRWKRHEARNFLTEGNEGNEGRKGRVAEIEARFERLRCCLMKLWQRDLSDTPTWKGRRKGRLSCPGLSAIVQEDEGGRDKLIVARQFTAWDGCRNESVP